MDGWNEKTHGAACRMSEMHMADLLLDPESVSAEVRAHAESCAACRMELASLRKTMGAMDLWEAPEPSPFFDVRLHARLRAEREQAPAGWAARLRARLLYGNGFHLRPATAGALALLLAMGGGATFWVEHSTGHPHVRESATVRDLQSFDGNAQLFQQLNALDSDEDDGGGAANQSSD